MNQAAVDLIAAALPAGLCHPGDDTTSPRVIPLPGFRTTGMSDEQAQELVGQSATLVAEALVHLLEGEYEILPKTEATQLRQDAADAPDGTRIIKVKKTPNTPPVLELTVGKSDEVIVPEVALKALCET